ncbi:MAG TPA: hypothetical protein DIU49_12800 [Desulfovibrio sp.]|nr:hypothetical protein [Desulfovibrio sp.]
MGIAPEFSTVRFFSGTKIRLEHVRERLFHGLRSGGALARVAMPAFYSKFEMLTLFLPVPRSGQ